LDHFLPIENLYKAGRSGIPDLLFGNDRDMRRHFPDLLLVARGRHDHLLQDRRTAGVGCARKDGCRRNPKNQEPKTKPQNP